MSDDSDNELEFAELCGETFDHDLMLIGDQDGIKTFECRNCGAEIDDDPEESW